MGLSLGKTLGKGEREEAYVVGESRYDPARMIKGENRKRVERENQNCSKMQRLVLMKNHKSVGRSF